MTIRYAVTKVTKGHVGLRRLFLVGLVLASTSAWATEFWVDPVRGSPSGDGSAARPWRTLKEVIDAGLVETRNWESLPYVEGKVLVPRNVGAPVKAGDTLWLRGGYHGEVDVWSHYNTGYVTVAAAPGEEPRLGRLLVRSSAYWVFKGLHISSEYMPVPQKTTLVQLEWHNYRGPVHHITLEGNVIQAVSDISGFTEADWVGRVGHGIVGDGWGLVIRGNHLKNVNYGIQVGAYDSVVECNTVENFAGDGLRGLGDDSVFQYNTVKNCYEVYADHRDGFQSWTYGPGGVGTGEVRNVVLRGNYILNYEDANQPFRCALQGIGNFDGTFVDWVVENNVIVTDHYHGITFMGARGVRVVNNTVLEPNGAAGQPGPPWIRVSEHKNGTPPQACVVRNNLAPKYANASVGVSEDHNLVVSDPAAFYVNPTTYDLRLKSGSPAIDVGSATLAPLIDVEGVARPQGAGVDLGAYEWRPSAPPVATAGAGVPQCAAFQPGAAR
ncbi:right-handed parallel beta-helix repeat-containing protein [Pyxidicoccus parkwayensis]|uniref:Right-handed parallel beta-helix repeat-containing protein n=1 Tax=Pyxidicoccus parkwayensis TaxID=2813578 RepID=A0ABX7NVN1_9BACT|nr:right-handed parallel beta-helix repeat-containing protein [Pyxidicoccus parkwaysis]QSQ22980.1 right-handed parallel beta-helix repeat-containing protein [Pyxidicoccus parkwaysis]